jgi:hypothetical protein
VEIVQDQHDRPMLGGVSQELGGCIEQPEARPFGLERGRLGQVTEAPAQLRDDLGELRRTRAKLRTQGAVVAISHVGPERLHPGPVGGRAARLPAAADQHPRPPRVGLGDQLLGEAALANTGLARDQQEAAAAGEGIIEIPDQLSQLTLAAHERASGALRRGLGRRRLSRGQLESGVLREDRPLELAQPLARLDTRLLDQGPACLLVGLQRFRLAVAAVERQHQLGAQTLAVGVLGDQRLELSNDLGVAAERQLGVDQLLQRRDPHVI